MKICHFNTLLGAHQVQYVILLFFKLSKLVSFIFKLFQSLELIKYVFSSIIVQLPQKLQM
jgi:hypothetical protein